MAHWGWGAVEPKEKEIFYDNSVSFLCYSLFIYRRFPSGVVRTVPNNELEVVAPM